MELLATCRRRLAEIAAAAAGDARPAAGRVAPPADDAVALLCDLDYLQRPPAAPAFAPTHADDGELANRLALLSLAARCERLFRLPCARAPDAVFLGAELRPARFGKHTAAPAVIGVGGMGLTLRAAFEACIGEAAEFLSFLSTGDEPLFAAAAAEMRATPAAGHGSGIPAAALDWMLDAVGLDRASRTDPIRWIRATSLDGGHDMPFPADLCLRRQPAADDPIQRAADSTGCAAGATPNDARYRALMEVIERDAIALWWYGGQPAAAIAFDSPHGAGLPAFLDALGRDDERPCRLLDLTTDLGVPVVAALSSDADGGSIALGFSADTDVTTAARGAILELCQVELARDLIALKERQGGPGALNDADRRHRDLQQRLHADRFPQLRPRMAAKRYVADGQNDRAALLAHCLAAVNDAGFASYGIDLTRPQIGIHVVKVLVPGLQPARRDCMAPRLSEMMKQNKLAIETLSQPLPLV